MPSLISPIAIPATCAFIGTPASISASEPPQTLAMELDPLDSVISDTTRMEYPNSSGVGSMFTNARLARRPCPISRRFGAPTRPVSPVA